MEREEKEESLSFDIKVNNSFIGVKATDDVCQVRLDFQTFTGFTVASGKMLHIYSRFRQRLLLRGPNSVQRGPVGVQVATNGVQGGLVSLFGTAYNLRDLRPFCWNGAAGSKLLKLSLHRNYPQAWSGSSALPGGPVLWQWWRAISRPSPSASGNQVRRRRGSHSSYQGR